jgi:hypothetical protein
MDHLSGEPPSFRESLRAAARDAGILPDDTLGPVIAKLADLPDEITLRLNPLVARAEDAARGAAAARVVRELPAALDRFAWRHFGAYLAAAAVVLAVGGTGLYQGGYRAGRADGEARAVHLEAAIGNALTRDDAQIWLALMQNNTGISAAPRSCAPQDGRLACQFVLWGGPAPPPADPTASAAAISTTPGNDHARASVPSGPAGRVRPP